MLLDIRETVRNSKPIKYTLITLICIPFALVGIGSYFGGGAYQDVAEVDGTPINEIQVDRAYNALKGRYQQMFGGNIPENLFPDETIRSQALDNLVTEIVVNNTVEEYKFAIGDETLGRAIRNNTQFHGDDGKFDKEIYQNMIQGSLDNVGNFEESLRASEAVAQFQEGIVATNFELPNEIERLEALRGQTRTIDYVTYSIDKAVENIEVTDEQINTYFDENAENYKFPERAKLEYIELKKSDLAEAVEISDEEVETHYNDNNSDFVTTAAVRETSHILLEVADAGDVDEVAEKTAELEAIKARIAAGEAFADLAKELSDDIGSAQSGGSMGLLEGSYLESQYVEAANQLVDVDELSGVVKTKFGVHLIKLDKYEPAVITPFEDAKEDIVSLLQNNAADSEFLELRTAMEENVASDPESLEVAADASNVEIKQSDWVDVDTLDDPVMSHPSVLSAAFSEDVLENQNNSDVLELNPGHLLSLRIIEHEEPRPKTLDDVKDDITTTLKREGAESQLKESAKTAVGLMLKGTPVSKVAEDDPNATAVADEILTRDSTVIDANAIQEIYALSRPSEGKVLVKSVALQNGDRVAYALKAVDEPEPKAAEDEDSEVAGGGEAPEPPSPPSNQVNVGQAELAAVIANLREKADVTFQQ